MRREWKKSQQQPWFCYISIGWWFSGHCKKSTLLCSFTNLYSFFSFIGVVVVIVIVFVVALCLFIRCCCCCWFIRFPFQSCAFLNLPFTMVVHSPKPLVSLTKYSIYASGTFIFRSIKMFMANNFSNRCMGSSKW